MNNWYKKITAACLIITALFTVTGCSNSSQPKEKMPTHIVTDLVGNKVELPQEVKKLAVVPIPFATIVVALDGNSNLLAAIHPGAMSAYKGSLLEKIDPNFAKLDTKLINQNFSVNMEGLAAANVDACLMWKYQEQDAQKLNKIGVKSVLIYNDTVDNLKKSFLIVGKILNKEDKAQELIKYYDESYNSIVQHKNEVAKSQKPTILFLRNPQLRLQGNDNFMHEALEISGAHNPFAQTALDQNNKSISMEEIYRINPDIIFLSNFDKFTPDDLYNNKIPAQDWSSIKAVKNHRVYKVPMGLYRWDAPSVETPLMMKWLAHTLQPQIFSNINVRSDAKDFYKKFLNIDLTDDELSLIFADEANKNSLPLD